MTIQEKWSDSVNWTDNWNVEHEIEGGAQAAVKKVKHKKTGLVAFLKILNRQTNTERRSRFFREAGAYATVSHAGIPSLIESNAHHHENSDYKVYLVTDFITGPSLTDYVAVNGAIDFAQAATITKSLSETIQHCHASEWVHRDIKPDNIILKNSQANTPILLDFGVAYKDNLIDDFLTDYGQELGNRFLRLPEMSVGSTAKRDFRTDISFLGGIFYYLLTAQTPSILTDQDGRMPHQRELTTERLKAVFKGPMSALSDFFDRAFSHRVSGRFVKVEDMNESLKRLVDMHEASDPIETDPTMEELLAIIKSSVSQRLAANKSLYDQAMTRIKMTHNKVLQAVQPTYVSYQTGFVNHVDGLRNHLGFSHFATHDNKFVPKFFIQILGDELVVMADEVSIFRTSADTPIFAGELEKNVERIYINGLTELAKKPPY